MSYLPFLFLCVFSSTFIWRGVLDTLAAALIPAVCFFGSFRSCHVGFRQHLGFVAFGRRWHQRQRCLLSSILLTTAGLAWRFFFLFCFLESKAESPSEGTFAMRDALRLIDRLIHLLGLLRIPFVILPRGRKDYHSCYKLLATATLLPNSNRIEAKFYIKSFHFQSRLPIESFHFCDALLLSIKLAYSLHSAS
jgi:hypothetical protein